MSNWPYLRTVKSIAASGESIELSVSIVSYINHLRAHDLKIKPRLASHFPTIQQHNQSRPKLIKSAYILQTTLYNQANHLITNESHPKLNSKTKKNIEMMKSPFIVIVHKIIWTQQIELGNRISRWLCTCARYAYHITMTLL